MRDLDMTIDDPGDVYEAVFDALIDKTPSRIPTFGRKENTDLASQAGHMRFSAAFPRWR